VAQARTVRQVALGALIEITGARRSLTDVLADPGTGFSELAPEDRARAQRLLLSSLRRALPADALLAPHLRKEPTVQVRAILRMAVTELHERPEDAHGIVDAAVSLAHGSGAGGAAAGFVNAVLRKISGAPVELAVQKLPGWLRRQLVQAWGKQAVAEMEAAHLAGAPLDLTLKHPGQAQHWAERLAADILPTGGLRMMQGGQVSALEGFAAGDWWVQDAAASIPAQVLDAGPGQKVLDLCAAPGGKTMQLAARGADVTALDLSATRLQRLEANLSRTGLAAQIVVADALDWTPLQRFDAILLDAPCSATGTIRRHPDLPFVRTRADVESLVALQARLIDRALDWLAPGGRLVYCTCSILPAEGEEQITAALARHPGVVLDAVAVQSQPLEWQSGPGVLRILPHHWAGRGGIDGFFIAAVRRS